MRLWKRLWCWLAGHDWVQLLSDPHAASIKSQFHTMAGCMGYCARCGFLWDDLPALRARTQPTEDDAGPYRTPAPMPACKCFVDKRGENRVHPDCPRHFETGPGPRRTLPKKRAPGSGSTSRTVNFTRVRVVKNGKVVKDETTGDFGGFDRTMKSFEKTMEEFGKTMDNMANDFDRAFGTETTTTTTTTRKDDKDTN